MTQKHKLETRVEGSPDRLPKPVLGTYSGLFI